MRFPFRVYVHCKKATIASAVSSLLLIGCLALAFWILVTHLGTFDLLQGVLMLVLAAAAFLFFRIGNYVAESFAIQELEKQHQRERWC